MYEPLSKNQRDRLVRRRRDELDQYDLAMSRSDQHPPYSLEEAAEIDRAEMHLTAAQAVEEDYFDRIPVLNMSVCPFDGKTLMRSFDPFGLDGPWWPPDAVPAEPDACPHFCVLLGALHFAGRKPRAGEFAVYPGPGVPYVVPRLLSHPSMVAVISQIRMENGYLAYPISYFAERRPPVRKITAGWARTNFVYTTQSGDSEWRIPNDPWDFDLKPWIETGRIRWCEPASDNSRLNEGPADSCPYLGIQGARHRVVVQGDRVENRGLPDGHPYWPILL
jgi:hypothetical protein